jgi:alkylation response protein AidB-like acyl-CoA dehydrogenase
LQTARQLAAEFALTAVERDERGGTPKAERDALRHSGLLALSIPTRFGGLGANWSETLTIVREFAKVDSSIAHVFGFHHLMLATVRLFSRPEQWQPWFEQTAQELVLGQCPQPAGHPHRGQKLDGWREFSGKKSFCSGASDSEMLIASAVDESAGGKLLIAAIPSGRSGITLHNDWNNIGQRQTDSGSATFERVRVEESNCCSIRPAEHAVRLPAPTDRPADVHPYVPRHCRRRLRRSAPIHPDRDSAMAQIQRPGSQPRPLRARPLRRVLGGLEGVRLLVERAADLLDKAWAKGPNLSAEERGHLATAIATAKVAATRNGLELCSRLFEVTGARSTHASLRLDRHWRNLRTQTLHDPVDYKLHELGDWALNQACRFRLSIHNCPTRSVPHATADPTALARPGHDPRHGPGVRRPEIPGLLAHLQQVAPAKPAC